MSKSVQIFLISILFIAVSCQKVDLNEGVEIDSNLTSNFNIVKNSQNNSVLTKHKLQEINLKLQSKGTNYQLIKAEAITIGRVDGINHTVVSKDVGNRQQEIDFVPGDLRRTWSAATAMHITFAIDSTNDMFPSGGILNTDDGIKAVRNAFKTWDNLKKTNLFFTEIETDVKDVGFVASVSNSESGSVNKIFADIQVAGWGDIDFEPGVLAVTFTFTFVDENGAPTDINNDGKADAAFREIYFDPSFTWTNNGLTGIDVESIALHEIGHGLSQGHFGTVFADKEGNVTKINPRAVMNAYYLEPYRILQPTDIAGHNKLWLHWPNN